MLKPSANIIRAPHKSYYSLVIAVAKRAREITEEYDNEGRPLVEKPVDLAVSDFVAGKYRIIESEQLQNY